MTDQSIAHAGQEAIHEQFMAYLELVHKVVKDPEEAEHISVMAYSMIIASSFATEKTIRVILAHDNPTQDIVTAYMKEAFDTCCKNCASIITSEMF
jgi:hypothetical protein